MATLTVTFNFSLDFTAMNPSDIEELTAAFCSLKNIQAECERKSRPF